MALQADVAGSSHHLKAKNVLIFRPLYVATCCDEYHAATPLTITQCAPKVIH